jgi:MFS family permease
VLRLLAAVGCASFASNALILHQVPALQAAGLSLAAASGYAGARGVLQITGRVGLDWLVRRLGLRGVAALAYAAGALGAGACCLALLGGPVHLLAALFALAAGFSIGLLSPTHGLLAAETYEDARLGTLSGMQQAVTSVAGAAGGWLTGLLVDSSGGYLQPMAAPAVAMLAAAAIIRSGTPVEAQAAAGSYSKP